MTDNEKLAENLKCINYDGAYSIDAVKEILQDVRINMEGFLKPTWYDKHKDMLDKLNNIIYETVELKKLISENITKYEEAGK